MSNESPADTLLKLAVAGWLIAHTSRSNPEGTKLLLGALAEHGSTAKKAEKPDDDLLRRLDVAGQHGGSGQGGEAHDDHQQKHGAGLSQETLILIRRLQERGDVFVQVRGEGVNDLGPLHIGVSRLNFFRRVGRRVASLFGVVHGAKPGDAESSMVGDRS